MSADDETARECRVCRALQPWSAAYCSRCGASMARASGAIPLLHRLVTEALAQLMRCGLDSEGLELQHGLRECLTALAAWERRPPEEDERSLVTERAVALAIAAGEYAGRR